MYKVLAELDAAQGRGKARESVLIKPRAD